jgi:hypothetical protein
VSKNKTTKDKQKRKSNMIQEQAPAPPSITHEEALARACLLVEELSDAMSKASRAVLLLGKPKRDQYSIVQALSACETTISTAEVRVQNLRQRIAAHAP